MKAEEGSNTALFTIGDLHLSFSAEKPMDKFGENWRDHSRKLEEGFRKVGEEDWTVLCGDLSWAMNLEGGLRLCQPAARA